MYGRKYVTKGLGFTYVSQNVPRKVLGSLERFWLNVLAHVD